MPRCAPSPGHQLGSEWGWDQVRDHYARLPAAMEAHRACTPTHGPLLQSPWRPLSQASHCLQPGRPTCASVPRGGRAWGQAGLVRRPTGSMTPAGPPRSGPPTGAIPRLQGLLVRPPGPCPPCPQAAWCLVLGSRETDRMGPVTHSFPPSWLPPFVPRRMGPPQAALMLPPPGPSSNCVCAPIHAAPCSPASRLPLGLW